MKVPLEKNRPVRTADGKGGWTTVYGVWERFWASFRVHKAETWLEDIDAGEDLQVEDIVKVETRA